MATLISYILHSTTEGDYDITLSFDDQTTSRQTIHFGILVDSSEETAKEQLDEKVAQYATNYQNGLVMQQQAPPTPLSLTAIVGESQEV